MANNLVLFMAALCLAATAHANFEVKLPGPPSSTEFATAGVGNYYFTVVEGGDLVAVDLNTKTIVWKKEFEGDYIQAMIGVQNPPLLLIGAGSGVPTLALSTTGELMWTSSAFTFSNPPKPKHINFVAGALFYLSVEQYGGSFAAVNLTTGEAVGAAANYQNINSGGFFENEVILGTESPSSGDNEVVCFELPSFKKKWTLQVNDFVDVNKDYLLVTDTTSSGNGEVLVLHPHSLSPYCTIKNEEGIYSNGVHDIIDEKFLLTEIESTSGYNHFALFSLTDCKKKWELRHDGSSSDGSAGESNAVATDKSVVLLNGLSLTFINATSGKKTHQETGVPVLESGRMSVSADKKTVYVDNLCGWTAWSSTGTYLGRNEQDPSQTTNQGHILPYKWGNYEVTTQGDYVVATGN